MLHSEKAMAPHSSILAWQIPWTEEPRRLQSMGLLGVRHDRVTSLSLFTFMHQRRKWQPTPVFLPGESQGRGSLVGCRLWGRTESDTTEVTQQQQQQQQHATLKAIDSLRFQAFYIFFFFCQFWLCFQRNLSFHVITTIKVINTKLFITSSYYLFKPLMSVTILPFSLLILVICVIDNLCSFSSLVIQRAFQLCYYFQSVEF